MRYIVYAVVVCCAFKLVLCGGHRNKHKVHIKIHVPVSILKHHHTNTVFIHKKPNPHPKPKPKPKPNPDHHYHNYYHHKSSAYSSYNNDKGFTPSNYEERYKAPNQKLTDAQKDLVIARLLSHYLKNTANQHKNPYDTKQSGIETIKDIPKLTSYDNSYIIGSGYEVNEQYPPLDKPENNHLKGYEEQQGGYMDPEKITEYISFIQKGYLNKDHEDFGSDHNDELDKFSDGSFDEANEHAGSEYSDSDHFDKNDEHSKYENRD